MFNIVLWQPEIPPNTGNVARLCAALDLPLHLVGPLGFRISDREVKRAGLDYWEHVRLVHHANREAFEAAHPDPPAWYFSTRGTTAFWDVAFRPGDFLVFGSETKGLPADLLEARRDRLLRIPQGSAVRSL
ncbi:MAG: tRNA (cytidine(34)-2'-O)-methyltransferase, partial [Candidatus Sericytochromatia bacterium]|nr:tRNA (cytidine(34)-2'-O)-methyltransferase [Candidatus Tanganyikabacteria bacterium]